MAWPSTSVVQAACPLSSSLLAKLAAFDALTVGRSDSNGAITASALTLPALTLISGTANITLAGVTGAGFDLTLNSGGVSTLGGAVSGVRNLDTDAAGSAVNADISTSGTQNWRDATSWVAVAPAPSARAA